MAAKNNSSIKQNYCRSFDTEHITVPYVKTFYPCIVGKTIAKQILTSWLCINTDLLLGFCLYNSCCFVPPYFINSYIISLWRKPYKGRATPCFLFWILHWSYFRSV